MSVRLAAVLALAVALLAAAPAAAGKRTAPRGYFGVMLDGALLRAPTDVKDAQFELMARSGVETVRLTLNWAHTQPSRKGRLRWSESDELIALAAFHGITVLPVVIYAPGWARAFKRRRLSPPRTGPYAAFVSAAVRRYRRGGSFWRRYPFVPQRPIGHWQLWNEPTLREFWRTPRRSSYAWPRGYVRLLKAANRAIKSADRRARTVTAGLVGPSWDEFRRLYRLGAKGSFDVAALHVYPQTGVRAKEAVRRVKREIKRAGDRRARIFLTELSFPASRGKAKPISHQRQETPTTMARVLGRIYPALLADRRRRRTGLDRVYWYTWASDYVRRSSNFNFAGLLASADGLTFREQPALRAFRRSAIRLQGCEKTELGVCR